MKLSELARRLECELRGNGDLQITGVRTIEEAGPQDLTFLTNKKYQSSLRTARAAAAILPHDAPDVSMASLRTQNPALAVARVLALFYPPYVAPLGVHQTAVIAPTARIGPRASIGPYAVIGDRVVIGAEARIYAHVVIYPSVEIGDQFTAHAAVVVREGTRIGHRVVLQSGAVLGGEGFGYVPLPDGSIISLPQTGTVVLEDDVEIGANTTVDRATVGTTRVRRGAKIDNLVQVAHGCEIGEHSFLAAQSGLAGSTKLEDHVQLGGQVGAAGHLTIGRRTMVAAQSGIPHDVGSGKVIGGYPAVDIRSWRRYSAVLPKLPELLRRVRRLEGRLTEEPADPE